MRNTRTILKRPRKHLKMLKMEWKPNQMRMKKSKRGRIRRNSPLILKREQVKLMSNFVQHRMTSRASEKSMP